MSGQDDMAKQPPWKRGRSAQYSTRAIAKERRITDGGSYDRLREVMHESGVPGTPTLEALQLLDELIAARPTAVEALAGEIGSFYGDVLVHNISTAHWVVLYEQPPEVRIAGTTTVHVVGVAERRMRIGYPALMENFEHMLALSK